MEKSVKKVTRLLNELALSSYNTVESAEGFLREQGYDPDELAKSMANKISQTIARLKNDWKRENFNDRN